MRVAALLLACGLALAACDPGPSPPPASDPTGPRPLPSPTSRRQTSSEPDARGRYRAFAVSAPVEIGVRYTFRLFTRCGIDYLVDFNGSLWDAVGSAGREKKRAGSAGRENKGPPKGFESPRDLGVMTLVNRELAEYESSAGKLVRFVRHPGMKKVKPCLAPN